MKEIVTKVFEFKELCDKAKEKAREWYRRCNDGDSSWSEFVIEDAVRQAKRMGIEIDTRVRQTHRPLPKPILDPCIWWSGFCSQGDGACFEGHWFACDVKADELKADCPQDKELHRIVDVFASIAKDYPNARFSVKHSGHYSHKYCTEFDVEMRGDTTEGSVFQKDEDALIENARDFMEWIYRTLEKEYEYQNSDEQIDQYMNDSEDTFTEDGERFG